MVKIIAEIGWNHMGDMKLAKKMIKAAKVNGADYAKFQTWSVDRLKSGPWDDDGRKEIYENAELSLEKHKQLKKYCDKIGIEFLSSVFSIQDIELLSKVTTKAVKIPSFESRNIYLIQRAIATFDHVFISTGTSTFQEIKDSLAGLPMHKMTILHCVSSYPCNPETANLEKINLLKELAFNVGYSDHIKGVESAKVALEYDIDVIEKHFTIDHDLPGRDNKFAILPHELKDLRDYLDLREKMKQDKGPGFMDSEIEAREIMTGRFNG